MKSEMRFVKASLLAGLTDIAAGFIMWKTGWGNWYNSTFHTWGILGFGLVAYSYWHYFFYKREAGKEQ